MKTNEELRADVLEEIKWDPQLKSICDQIGIAAMDGVITLSGRVDTYVQKLAAERAAQRVSGVKVVAVDLEVNTEPSKVKSDTEIATAIKNALSWHSAVNEDQIEVMVDTGWVFLDGMVEWDYMKKAAQTAVENLIGVRGVTNRVQVKSRSIDPIEIKRKIVSAFHRSASIDSANIQVDVLGSKIILHGKVRTWSERQEAENAAWSSPGVITVENKIEVDTALVLSHV